MSPEQEKLLHHIDTQLAVMQALQATHSDATDERFDRLEGQGEEVQKELAKLKMRVAGIAGTVSIVVLGAAKAFGALPW